MSDTYNLSPAADAIFAIKKMKRSILFASMAIAAGLAMVNTYTSVVDAPSWGSQIPGSLETARKYYQSTNPGDFFRIFSPINQALGLLCVVLFWKRGGRVRGFLLAAFVLYVIGEGMTFLYFYPRNDIMFTSSLADTEGLRTTWEQWCRMNWVRTGVIAAGFVCSATALHYSYATSKITRRIHEASFARESSVQG
jgi:hypothetical protein